MQSLCDMQKTEREAEQVESIYPIFHGLVGFYFILNTKILLTNPRRPSITSHKPHINLTLSSELDLTPFLKWEQDFVIAFPKCSLHNMGRCWAKPRIPSTEQSNNHLLPAHVEENCCYIYKRFREGGKRKNLMHLGNMELPCKQFSLANPALGLKCVAVAPTMVYTASFLWLPGRVNPC